MSREAHVRFWEGAGVRLPRATCLPLNRQVDIFARHGVELSRQTLCDWVAEGGALLAPIHRDLTASVFASKVIHTDTTPVPV